MTEQPRFDVLLCEGLLQEWVVVQIDLANRQVIGCPPVRIHQCLLFVRQHVCHHCLLSIPCRRAAHCRRGACKSVVASVAAVRRIISAAGVSSVYFPTLAAPLARAPLRKTSWPALRFSSRPCHASSAGSWSARP